MEKMIEMYAMLNDEQRERIFTKEQRDNLDALLFFKKMTEDRTFYKAVEQAVGEAIWEQANR